MQLVLRNIVVAAIVNFARKKLTRAEVIKKIFCQLSRWLFLQILIAYSIPIKWPNLQRTYQSNRNKECKEKMKRKIPIMGNDSDNWVCSGACSWLNNKLIPDQKN